MLGAWQPSSCTRHCPFAAGCSCSAPRSRGGSPPARAPCRPRPELARRILATSLERVIDAAEEPPRLIGLAAELRDTGTPVNVRGVALVDNLLTDGGSPLYAESADETLEGAIRHARAALLLSLMDLLSIAIGLVAFAALLALVELLDRV